MSVNLIEIETERLQNDIQKMTEAVEDAEKQTGAMFDSMNELDSMWDGPANNAFRAQFQTDHASMEEMCKEVRELISCMEFARKSYDQCEDDVLGKIQSLKLEGGD